MNRNVMIVLAGGFLIAVLVALLVQASLSGGKKEPEPIVLKEEPKVQIIVASKDLRIGDELSDDNMRWQEWPKNAIFPGAVVREEDKKPSESISGRLRRAIKEGEPIVDAALIKEQGNFMAASLNPGMRAFSINVSPAGMVSGFVSPGDYVDIILTYRRSVNFPTMAGPDVEETIDEHMDNMATETILQNVKVLAVDQNPGGGEDDEAGAQLGKTITLEVDYKSAEVLAMATQMGTMTLTLRRLGDEHIYNTAEVTTDARITHIYQDILGHVIDPNAQNKTGNASRFVRIYRGDQVESLSVNP